MYFPYLRGKQFELIALRELSRLMSENSGKISPIIEPVKYSSTLKSTVTELSQQGVNFNIIINPLVGDLVGRTDQIVEAIGSSLGNYTNFQLAINVHEGIDLIAVYDDLLEMIDFDFNGISLIHNSIQSDIRSQIEQIERTNPVVNNVIYSDKTTKRYYREFTTNTRVELDDYFKVLPRNADYLEIEDSQFSEEHLFYEEEGYKGFSDFLTIGDSYSESGFLPYAVAIHFTYSDEENKLRIRHFVSDSNYDSSDIAGKFAEALEKLILWCRDNPQGTQAESEFENLYENGHFPGLGSLKKLSIKQHIEVVINLI